MNALVFRTYWSSLHHWTVSGKGKDCLSYRLVNVLFQIHMWSVFYHKLYVYVSVSDPGTPAASRLLAMSTSQLQMSNCHFWRPKTPQRTEPEWTPILMSSSCCSSRRTNLQHTSTARITLKLHVHSVFYWCVYLPYCVDHAEAHLHAAASVCSLRLWDSCYTVITVAQDLNTQTLMLLQKKKKQPLFIICHIYVTMKLVLCI